MALEVWRGLSYVFRTRPQETYIVLSPVKLQGVSHLGQLTLQRWHLLLLLQQPGRQHNAHNASQLTKENSLFTVKKDSQSLKLWGRHCCAGLLLGEWNKGVKLKAWNQSSVIILFIKKCFAHFQSSPSITAALLEVQVWFAWATNMETHQRGHEDKWVRLKQKHLQSGKEWKF